VGKPLIVKLGSSRSALPMTAAPDGDFRVLGVVQQGIELGYLVVSSTGDYLQVNGSMARSLNASRVRAAIRGAEKLHMRKRSNEPRAQHPNLQQAVVVVRKRRRVPLPRETLGEMAERMKPVRLGRAEAD
jgi:hypothetical protein